MAYGRVVKLRGTALALSLVLLALLTGAVLGNRLLSEPSAVELRGSEHPGAGFRVQDGLADLLLRQGGGSGRSDPIVITAPALNEFLRRHLEARRLTVRPLVVRVGRGWLELAGRTSPRRLSRGASSRGLYGVLPDAFLDLDLWLVLRGRLVVHDGQGELVVDAAAVGRQPIPPSWLWGILGVRADELLTWRMPRIVERVELEPGRVIVHTRRPGA